MESVFFLVLFMYLRFHIKEFLYFLGFLNFDWYFGQDESILIVAAFPKTIHVLVRSLLNIRIGLVRSNEVFQFSVSELIRIYTLIHLISCRQSSI